MPLLTTTLTERPSTADPGIQKLDLAHHQSPSDSPAPTSRVIRSRRRRYLELQPSYFQAATQDLEVIDPLSYDRLVRQHQTAAERQAEGETKGWAGVLQSSLLRGEAKLESLKPETELQADGTVGLRQNKPDWSVAEEEELPVNEQKTRDLERWNNLLMERFVAGEDDNFDYTIVDQDPSLDGDWKEQKIVDEWFEDEEEFFESKDGETGVQDF